MFSGGITKFKNPNGGLPVTQTSPPTFGVSTVLNSSTVQFNITSSLTDGQTLYYTLLGNVTNQNFTTGSVSGSFALDNAGNATVTFGCNVYHDIGNTNTFQFQLRTGGIDGGIVGLGTNVTIQSLTNITATGGNITNYVDPVKGPQRIHTFDTPGNTTFNISLGNYPWGLTDEYSVLIVAGGGAGGNIILIPGTSAAYAGAGGGGAGGVLQLGGNSVTTLGSTSYNISVGAGGSLGQNGSNSAFGSNTAIGGGRGGSMLTSSTFANATIGGSGGGGWADTSRSNVINASGPGALGTAGPPRQGYAGSNGYASTLGPYELGGGGGGAGGNGVNPVESPSNARKPGDGGVGITSNITGSSVYYAGGGGGSRGQQQLPYTLGLGGLGGGGNTFVAGTNGLGGGGGANAAGGSGVVIVRYPVVDAYRYFQ